MVNFNPIRPVPPIELPEVSSAPKSGGAAAFADQLRSAVENLDAVRQKADAGVDQFLRGEDVELHSVMLDSQRASLAFELAMGVRNKVVQAYQEIMRMQV